MNALAANRGILFLEAVPEVLEGILLQALQLILLVEEVLVNISRLNDSPAMSLKGMPLESISYLGGYIIDGYGQILRF
jgi:hypothetical protein